MKRARSDSTCMAAAAPLDQGKQGTCVCYAFAQCVAQGLLTKYEFAVNPETFVEKVKTLCPSWEGNKGLKICREWNTLCTREHAKVEDVNRGKRLIRFRVEGPVAITEFEAACNLMDAAAGVLYMMVAIKIPRGGLHKRHAVAAWMTYPTAQGRAMAAMNSWGGAQPIMHVTRANFIRAILIEPELVEQVSPPPHLGRLYESRLTTIAAKREEVILAMVEKAAEGGGAALKTVVEAGVIPPLVQLLVRGTDEKKEKAVRALEKLAANAANRAQIVQAGAMPPLTALLDSADDALKGSALRVVVYLAAKANAASAIKPLVAMLSGTNDAQTNNALDVLLDLAKDEANRAKLAGAIKPLVALLRGTDDAQKEKAARVLQDLACEQAYEVPIAQAGAIPPLTALLSSTDDALKGSAAPALFNLAFNETNQVKIGRAGAIRPLVQLLVDATQAYKDEKDAAAELMKHAAGALFHLAANEANTEKILQAGGSRALVNVVKMLERPGAESLLAVSGGRDVLEHAAGGLFHLSDKYHITHAIEPLVEVVKLRASADYDSDNDTLVEYAAGALFRLKSEVRVPMAKTLVIPPLVALLSGAAKQQEYAAGALAYFSGFQGNQPAIQRAGAIRPLVSLLDAGPGTSRRRDAAETLSILAKRNDTNYYNIVGECGLSDGSRAFRDKIRAEHW